MNNKHILILRRKYGTKGTNGTIYYAGELICHTIELPDKNNEKKASCIPEGTYRLRGYHSHKYPNEIGISGVPNRSGILFHVANYAQGELQGCIAPVTTHTGEGRGDNSAPALAKLKALVYSLWDQGGKVFVLIKG